MANAVKVLIVEQNGAELQNQTELDLTASNIPFSSSLFTATDVSNGIIEAGIFGLKRAYQESLGSSSTTSTTTYSTKVTLSLTGLDLGTYLLYHTGTYNTGNANREVQVRVMDGATELFNVQTSVIRVQGENLISGFIPITGVSGNKTYTLEFRVGGSATTAYARDARLILWRFN